MRGLIKGFIVLLTWTSIIVLCNSGYLSRSKSVTEPYLFPSVTEQLIIDCEHYDSILIKEIKNEINKLDSVVLRWFFIQGIRIKLVDNFTDEPKLQGYYIPKHASALYYDKTVYALIHEHQYDGQVSKYIHELGHAYDYNSKIGGKMLSEQSVFQACWQEDSSALFPNVNYYNSSSTETFAQCFALYYYSSATKQYLNLKAPNIYNYLENIKHTHYYSLDPKTSHPNL